MSLLQGRSPPALGAAGGQDDGDEGNDGAERPREKPKRAPKDMDARGWVPVTHAEGQAAWVAMEHLALSSLGAVCGWGM